MNNGPFDTLDNDGEAQVWYCAVNPSCTEAVDDVNCRVYLERFMVQAVSVCLRLGQLRDMDQGCHT
jgi:hypothetical protein